MSHIVREKAEHRSPPDRCPSCGSTMPRASMTVNKRVKLSIGNSEFEIESSKLVNELLDLLAVSFKRDVWHYNNIRIRLESRKE